MRRSTSRLEVVDTTRAATQQVCNAELGSDNHGPRPLIAPNNGQQPDELAGQRPGHATSLGSSRSSPRGSHQSMTTAREPASSPDRRPITRRRPAAAGDLHQLGERRREDRVRDAAGGPDLVVLLQGPVDQRAQRRRVADRRDPADRPGPSRCGRTPATPAAPAARRPGRRPCRCRPGARPRSAPAAARRRRRTPASSRSARPRRRAPRRPPRRSSRRRAAPACRRGHAAPRHRRAGGRERGRRCGGRDRSLRHDTTTRQPGSAQTPPPRRFSRPAQPAVRARHRREELVGRPAVALQLAEPVRDHARAVDDRALGEHLDLVGVRARPRPHAQLGGRDPQLAAGGAVRGVDRARAVAGAGRRSSRGS